EVVEARGADRFALAGLFTAFVSDAGRPDLLLIDRGQRPCLRERHRFARAVQAILKGIGRLSGVQDLRERCREKAKLIPLRDRGPHRAADELDFANLHDARSYRDEPGPYSNPSGFVRSFCSSSAPPWCGLFSSACWT